MMSYSQFSLFFFPAQELSRIERAWAHATSVPRGAISLQLGKLNGMHPIKQIKVLRDVYHQVLSYLLLFVYLCAHVTASSAFRENSVPQSAWIVCSANLVTCNICMLCHSFFLYASKIGSNVFLKDDWYVRYFRQKWWNLYAMPFGNLCANSRHFCRLFRVFERIQHLWYALPDWYFAKFI